MGDSEKLKAHMVRAYLHKRNKLNFGVFNDVRDEPRNPVPLEAVKVALPTHI